MSRLPDRAVFGRILGLARTETRRIVLATLALLCTTGLTLAYPKVVGLIIDSVQGGGGVEAVNRYAVWLVGLFAVGAVMTGLRSYLFTVAGEAIVARLRQRLYSSLVRQDIGFFDAHRTGELTNRLASDTTIVQSAATVNVSMALRYGLTATGAVGILFFVSWKLTLVMLALVPVATVGALFYGRFVRRLSRQVQDALARSTEVAEETLAGIRTVRAFAREGVEDARYAGHVDTSFELARKRSMFSATFGGIASFAGYGAIAGVLWYGGLLLVEGAISMGDLTAFLLYTFTVAFSIGALGGVWGDFMRAIGSTERVFELIDRLPVVRSGDKRLDSVRGEVHFEGVCFNYPTRPDVPILRDFDLKLEPGEVVALVGPSGGGKSTVAALISRFYDPDAGTVRLDGHDARALDADWLREQVGVVAQEPILFATSVRENIGYGRPGASDAAVREAARAAHAHDFVVALPEGYDTSVGERGVRLSGGQKQRVAIARALLKDPRVLVLDEATSALDAESEHLVKSALNRLMEGRTTLVIAHRLSTVQSADRIVVIDGGRLVEQGGHEELLAHNGLYRQLVERQFAAELS